MYDKNKKKRPKWKKWGFADKPTTINLKRWIQHTNIQAPTPKGLSHRKRSRQKENKTNKKDGSKKIVIMSSRSTEGACYTSKLQVPVIVATL